MNGPEPGSRPQLALFPMHGETKMRGEGLRTRDGHLSEWFSKFADVTIVSRPEPWPLLSASRRRHAHGLPDTWTLVSPQPVTVPPLRDRFRWWHRSQRYAAAWPEHCDAGVVWNPFARLPARADVRVGLDLLDDWSVHAAYVGIRREVEEQYRQWFTRANVVTANSEGTLALAARFGRDDAVLLPNGCDPSRFTQVRSPNRNRFVVGYGGKIGSRVDLALVRQCALALPEVEFQFAGPLLDKASKQALRDIENVRLLGDVHYSDYPRVLEDWDLGWVPHGVGESEVGGDAIKVYEYRAAGLPVVMTKIIGHDRAPVGVVAVEPQEMIPTLQRYAACGPGGLPRDAYETLREHTWADKAARILDTLQVSTPSAPSGAQR